MTRLWRDKKQWHHPRLVIQLTSHRLTANLRNFPPPDGYNHIHHGHDQRQNSTHRTSGMNTRPWTNSKWPGLKPSAPKVDHENSWGQLVLPKSPHCFRLFPFAFLHSLQEFHLHAELGIISFSLLFLNKQNTLHMLPSLTGRDRGKNLAGKWSRALTALNIYLGYKLACTLWAMPKLRLS